MAKTECRMALPPHSTTVPLAADASFAAVYGSYSKRKNETLKIILSRLGLIPVGIEAFSLTDVW